MAVNGLTEVPEQYPGISPTISVTNVNRAQVVVADSVLAVAATRRIQRIVDVAADSSHKVAGPLLACLPRRWVEYAELVRLAGDNETAGARYISNSSRTIILSTH